jgi:hypothetical protein
MIEHDERRRQMVYYSDIIEFLDERELRYYESSRDESILVPFDTPLGQVVIRLATVENGEGLSVRTQIMMIPLDHEHKQAALETLLFENYKVKVGRLGFDPRDGEVTLDWFIAVEDGLLTKDQFFRTFDTVMLMSALTRRKLARVLATGSTAEDTETDDAGDALDLLSRTARLHELAESPDSDPLTRDRAEALLEQLRSSLRDPENDTPPPPFLADLGDKDPFADE